MEKHLNMKMCTAQYLKELDIKSMRVRLYLSSWISPLFFNVLRKGTGRVMSSVQHFTAPLLYILFSKELSLLPYVI